MHLGGQPRPLCPLSPSLPRNCYYFSQDASPPPFLKTIYSWCCTGPLPWQQGNAGGLVSGLASLMVLWGPQGSQRGCTSPHHLLRAVNAHPPRLPPPH